MPNIAALLQRTLPQEALHSLRLVGRLASRPDGPAKAAYLVGGPVRDTILGRHPEDLDVSVVGDAHEFADLLAADGNGKVERTSQEFGTARVSMPMGQVDVATARRETYEEPGALPVVEPSGIEDDLARRDFTVNAMSVSLAPSSWGDLIDPHGGFGDTARKMIRVLHDDSFRDDPTRIFRALRYEHRLSFRIKPSTVLLMQRDSGYVDRVSSARMRAELEKMLCEPVQADLLEMADERGLLAAIDPSFRIGRAALAAMRRLPGREFIFYLALATAALTTGEARALVARLAPPSEWREVILAAPHYRSISVLLKRDDLSPSEVAGLLSEFPPAALDAQREIAAASPQKARLDAYMEKLRHVRPEITGDDLLAAGIPQGPEIGRLLDEAKRARLDGSVTTRQEEMELVGRRQRLAARS